MIERKVDNGKIKLGKDYFLSNSKNDIEEELYKSYAEILATGKSSSNTFLAKLLEKDFSKLKAEDTYNAMASINALGRIVKSTSDYFKSKEANDSDYSSYLLNKGLMDWQRKVFGDLSKRIALIAGRRAGKSYEIVSEHINHCLVGFDEVDGIKKYRQAIYIGLTLEKAAATIWQLLKDTMEKCHINCSKIDNANYTIYFSNGASIKLWGNNSKSEREKLRGLDSSMFVIDECQSQQGLLYLVNSIIGPIIKGRNGKLMLSGTGPLSAGTYWEDAINNGSFSVHKATMRDNTTIPNYEHALEEVLRDNNWTEDNITFRREYLGEIVHDTNLLVYPFRHYFEDLPKVQWDCCYIGVDFGFVDNTAIAPILIDRDGNLFLVNEFKQNRMTASAIVDKIKEVVDFISKTYNIDKSKIKVITDNNEQNISRDVYNAGIYNIQNAYKQDQKYQLALVRDALEAKVLKISKNGYFDSECEQMVWKWNSEKEEVIYELDDETFHGDICDAVQYAVATYYSDTVGEK